MIRIVLLLSILVALVGCQSNRGQLVGTWKGNLNLGKSPRSMEGVMEGLANAMVGDMTLEFSGSGKVKMSLRMGSKVSDYSISGNEVTIQGLDKDNKPTKFYLEGDTLRTKKDFDSDPELVFKKVSSEDPGAK